MRRGAWTSLSVVGANCGEVEGATLTKEAPDALQTPGSLLPPEKMGGSCASADAVHS